MNLEYLITVLPLAYLMFGIGNVVDKWTPGMTSGGFGRRLLLWPWNWRG